MRNAESYPFDPRARIQALRGADKVRAIPDRELAGHLLRLLDAIDEQPAPKPRARQLALPRVAQWARCLEGAA